MESEVQCWAALKRRQILGGTSFACPPSRNGMNEIDRNSNLTNSFNRKLNDICFFYLIWKNLNKQKQFSVILYLISLIE